MWRPDGIVDYGEVVLFTRLVLGIIRKYLPLFREYFLGGTFMKWVGL